MSLTNGWTGGQYSLFRASFGVYLLAHFGLLLPWSSEVFSSRGMLPEASASPLYPLFPNLLFVLDAPAAVVMLLVAGLVLSALFALGMRDRLAALGLWYVWACLFTRNPLIQNPGLPYIGWLLLAHACLPSAPFGSYAARGRPDPRGGWQLPAPIFAAAWIVMAVGYSYSGLTKLGSPSWLDGSALAYVLQNPLARPGPLRDLVLALPAPLLVAATWSALALELSFAPLALVRVLRPWLWTAMLGMHVSLALLVDFADLSLGMLMLQLFTFDPAWVKPRRTDGIATLFYDGGCGLCHRTVRALLSEDPQGAAFRFAPLESNRLGELVPAPGRAELPDSLVLVTPDGSIHTRSAAVLEVARRLGGVWALGARAISVAPTRLLDAAYDAVARARQRLFARPPEACPRVPEDLRRRFDS